MVTHFGFLVRPNDEEQHVRERAGVREQDDVLSERLHAILASWHQLASRIKREGNFRLQRLRLVRERSMRDNAIGHPAKTIPAMAPGIPFDFIIDVLSFGPENCLCAVRRETGRASITRNAPGEGF